MKNKEIALPQEVLSEAVPAFIHIAFLHGIQLLDEYTSEGLAAIATLLKTKGVNFLRENPIFVCLLPFDNQNSGRLIIVNGHHRTRVAPSCKISHIPALVFSPQTIATSCNQPVEFLAKKWTEWSAQTEQAFAKKYEFDNKTYRPPLPIQGVSQLKEFQKLAEEKNKVGIYS